MWKIGKIHIFEFDDDIIAFNTLQGKPYLINRIEKALLKIRGPFTLEQVHSKLENRFHPQEIQTSFQRLVDLKLIIPFHNQLPDKPTEPDFSTITNLELNIAEDCNFRCAYCCVGQGGFGADKEKGRARKVMDWDVAQCAIDLLFQKSLHSPALHIRFFGGEPLLNWDVIQRSVLYAEGQAQKRGSVVSFSIVTNGALLNPEIIAFLSEHDFWVQVSIDGTPQMHNAFRLDMDGQGSYAQATKFVPLLLETLKPQNAHARGTITHFKPDLLEAFNHLRGLGFSAPELRPVTGHEPSYGMTVPDLLRCNEDASVLARRLLRSEPGDVDQYRAIFNPYLSLLTSTAARRPPCAAGRTMIGVSAEGQIVPCTDMVGKEHEALDFGDVRYGLNEDARQRFLRIVDVDNKIGCQKCWARYMCGGACASVELQNEDGLEHNAGLECIWIRHVIELSIWLYVKMLQERPGLFYELYAKELKVDWDPLAEILAMEHT